jgi:hypothetical protein
MGRGRSGITVSPCKLPGSPGALLAALVISALLAGCSGSTAATASPPASALPPTVAPASPTSSAATSTPPSQQSGFVATGSMTVEREGAAAILLQDGRVLIVGGSRFTQQSGATLEYELATAELYDPATGKFTATGSMSAPRSHLTATLLSNGKVLVAGGYTSPPTEIPGGPDPLDTAELYDPVTGTFTPTGSMTDARDGHTATLLQDGRVLIAGGTGGENDAPLASDEIYDPATGTFTATAAMSVGRADHTASLLDGGWVFVTGGTSGDYFNAIDSTEGYDPTTGAWQDLGSMTTARAGHTATYLGSLVSVGPAFLICGGIDGSGAFVATCERYDFVLGTFAVAGTMTSVRYDGAAVLLKDGRVLLVGGTVNKDDAAANTADLYSATAGLSSAGPMTAARAGATATLLSDGSVLIAGGYDGNKTLASAELYKP